METLLVLVIGLSIPVLGIGIALLGGPFAMTHGPVVGRLQRRIGIGLVVSGMLMLSVPPVVAGLFLS